MTTERKLASALRVGDRIVTNEDGPIPIVRIEWEDDSPFLTVTLSDGERTASADIYHLSSVKVGRKLID